MSGESTRKRLVKNTVLMYIRMAFLMVISLYTSRVVLQVLGITDFGIYNVVGSIVAMFASLRLVFASSTQRFLSYEMGQGNTDRLKDIFNMSLLINFFIAIIFILLIEIVGEWFISNKMVLDESRLDVTRWVFRFSVIAAVLGIITTTFDACIIAHERMDFYAILSIVEGLMKLGVVYALTFFSIDKLFLYGLLLLVVAFVVLLANIVFCRINFSECKYQLTWNRNYIKNMASFAGWNFLGNTSYTLSQNGMNMVLNVFGGPVVNAARGIAFQVYNALQQVIGNISVVIKPFAIKAYSSGQVNMAMEILYFSSKVYFVIQTMIVGLFIYFDKEIIQLWLGQVPEYSVVFLDLVLLDSVVRSLHNPIDILFYSVGDLKYYQIIEGINLLLPLLFSYIALSIGCDYSSAFVIIIVMEIINMAAIVLLAEKKCGLDKNVYLKRVVLPCIVLSVIFAFFLALKYQTNFSSLVKVLMLILMFTIICAYMLCAGLNKWEKQQVISIVKRSKR